MNTVELKRNFHNLIDKIDNGSLLAAFYKIMKYRASSKDGQLWESLSLKEREELYEVFDESEDSTNLIDGDIVKEKHSKWLRK